MSLIPTISRPAPADGLEMSQSWTVVPDACRMATPKLSPVTVIASSRTVTFEAVTSTVPCTSNPANTVPAPEISTPPLDQDQPGPLDTWLGTERSDATWGPVLVASGKPHACGLAAQSVCRVTGPPPPPEGDGWAEGCARRLWIRDREKLAMALLMASAPACRLSAVSIWTLAWGEWSPPALSMAAGRGGCPSQWGAASTAEAIRAKPATVAAAHAGLCRSADAVGHR